MSILNSLIANSLRFVPKPIVRKVSSRYIAGDTLDDAVLTVRKLNACGAMATVDVLGEFITDIRQAEENTTYSQQVLRRIRLEGLEGNLSLKLTSIGLGLDDAVCERNLRRILLTSREEGDIFVRFDMENSPYTDRTIALYKQMRSEGFNVGIVLQAYMRRTRRDIADLLATGKTNVRICKGIYVEDESIAFKGREEIRDNYMATLRDLFEGGAYVGIATHDDVLTNAASELTRSMGLDRSAYEFQMLLGVREELRNSLLDHGERLRIYVPFGADWYGYSLRRLKENPSIAGYVLKAFLTGK